MLPACLVHPRVVVLLSAAPSSAPVIGEPKFAVVAVFGVASSFTIRFDVVS